MNHNDTESIEMKSFAIGLLDTLLDEPIPEVFKKAKIFDNQVSNIDFVTTSKCHQKRGNHLNVNLVIKVTKV